MGSVTPLSDWMQAQLELPEGHKPEEVAKAKNACSWGQHVWIDVGFRHEKLVCKHCDVEKEK